MCKGGCQVVQDDFYHFNTKLYFACVRATFFCRQNIKKDCLSHIKKENLLFQVFN